MISPAEIYARYSKKLASLAKLSKGGENGDVFVDSPSLALNFDKIKEDYVRGRSQNKGNCNQKEISSNDVLFYDDKNKNWVFIEFKNAKLGDTAYDLRKKNYDSVLIFSDIAEANLEQIRTNMRYILVYSGAKNASALASIENAVHSFAGRDLIRFGVAFFENYCFSSVETVTESDFVEKILPSLSFYNLKC